MSAHTVQLHERRTNGYHHLVGEINDDALLKAAYHQMQLHWLKSVPGYREEIKQRLAVAARAAQLRDQRLDRSLPHLDLDRIGQEIEPCG